MKNLEYKGRWVYNWFSNMEISPIVIDGITYASVENYYQSQKTLDPELQKNFLNCLPKQAKRLGRQIKIRDDWEQVKEQVMEKALRAKFAPNTIWLEKLLNTGDEEIVEWNNWKDKIWGKTLDGIGENKLGKLLMKIRNEYNAT